MTVAMGDGELKRAIGALEESATVMFGVKRRVVREDGRVSRGSPALCGRGLSAVQLPGEAVYRELEPYELEAILELARAGEVRLAVPWIPALGRGGGPRWAAFRLEDGMIVTPESERYPVAAIWGA